jgi:GNAT superfamily N-acetyltransferase
MQSLNILPPQTEQDWRWLEQLWAEEWGGHLMVTRGRAVHVRETLPLIAWKGEHRVGAVTLYVEGEEAEMMSLNALESGKGIGSDLLEAAEREAWKRGARRIVIITTNDNLVLPETGIPPGRASSRSGGGSAQTETVHSAHWESRYSDPR